MSEEVHIPVGDAVICDLCSKDYTNSDESGGFIIPGWGVCPTCAPNFREELKKNNEESHIVAECPADMSHKDWIISVRGKDAAIIIKGHDEKS